MIRTYYRFRFSMCVSGGFHRPGSCPWRARPRDPGWTVTRVDVSMVSFCSGKNVILAYYVSMVCMVTVMISLAEKKTAGEFS
jgi:hypothetical protein